MLSRVEHEKGFITTGSGLSESSLDKQSIMLVLSSSN